ncbi:MAG TPA: helicase-related protein [Chloroflexota bacterium]|nr:helicase-related protein [Chloroflexota bacterium]
MIEGKDSEAVTDSHRELADIAAGLVNRQIKLPKLFASPVYVDAATVENGLIYLRMRTHDGELIEIPVPEDDLTSAAESLNDRSTTTVSSGLVPPRELFLLIESARIRLAFSFDPYFAVSLSGVQALPHQLEAVYMYLLPQARLRFLLADDPGAGKTIMAGLLVKELKLRGSLERVLILCPAPLTLQWQDELRSKFDETFEVVNANLGRNQLAGNAWDRFPLVIASLDFAKQDHVWQDILRVHWDMVIIDEAHKCSARSYGDKVNKTRRYALAERLSAATDRLLLLTATPHQGSADQFANFLKLLDPDQFADAIFNRKLLQANDSPFFLRRMKESLRDFEGRKLFTERHVITQPFSLTSYEKLLYDAVTTYINQFLPRARGKRKMSVSLARIVLQRRLASSLRAIRRSLENRHDRLSVLLHELEALSENERARRLATLQMIQGVDDEQDEGDQDDEAREELIERVTVAQRLDDLRREVVALEELVKQARDTEHRGQESKLAALRSCLLGTEFDSLRDGRGKLLIFTEHRDTLGYLRENLESWGYTTCGIHGQMDAQARKAAQDDFRQFCQICVATEAAGEGINLQFCHLMINYDLPWNPVRLEQRMGRIHRIGQQTDVYVFNFVAENTVEGQVLERLLHKLDAMREALGGRVFDVIGELLRLNDVRLEDILREAAYSPRSIDAYLEQIERIDPNRLKEYEEATGIALAKKNVDLSRVNYQDIRSFERRLMPEYVESFFRSMAESTMVRLEDRADGLLRIEHVPVRLRQVTSAAARRYGLPSVSYPKLTFRKQDLLRSEHADAELLSPGHPLFAAMVDDLEQRFKHADQGCAAFIDPTTQQEYRLHFFQVQVLGEEPAGASAQRHHSQKTRTVVLHEQLSVVREDGGGTCQIVSSDILHDLTPDDESDSPSSLEAEHRAGIPTADDVRRLERWVQATIQLPMTQDLRSGREREVTIRQEYLKRSFDELLKVAQQRAVALNIRVMDGEDTARLARDEAIRRVTELQERCDRKNAELAHLRVLRPGPVLYRGSALVRPVTDPSIAHLMRRDDEVEAIAMAIVLEYERSRGWAPEDVSRANDGSGFDIRSIGPVDHDGLPAIRRIEVKGRAFAHQDVMLTPNEWLQAHRHGPTYWLYVVYDCASNKPRLLTIQNPAEALAADTQQLIEVKGYRIAAEAIEQTGYHGRSETHEGR